MPRLRRVVSVDIGSSLIKLVQLNQSSEKIRLERVAIIENPTSHQSSREDREAVAVLTANIKHSLKKNHITVKDAVSSLSGPSIIIQYFKFPRISEKELENAVNLEAQRMMTTKLDAMDTDFQVLPQYKKATGEQEILFVAAPRKMVQQRMEMLRHAGLNPIAIDIDCLALANSFLSLRNILPGEHIMILNLGASTINIAILGKNSLYFIRDISLNLKDSVDYVDKSVLDTAFNEIDRSIHYFEARARGSKVDKVILTGGGSATSEITNVFSGALNLPLERWNPLENIEFDDRKLGYQFEEDQGYLLSIAIGLGLREE